MDRAAHANPLGEHQRELAADLPHVHPPRRVHRAGEIAHTQSAWNHCRLIEDGLDAEVPDAARVAPDAVAAVGEHAEPVVAGGQVGVRGLARGTGVHPVAIVVVEAIPETHAGRIGQRQDAECDLHV